MGRIQERFIPKSRRLKPVDVAKTLEQTTKIEMDLRLEAAALSELSENTQNDPGFRVPQVDWVRTGRDVVTMEWIDGIKMSDVEGLKASHHDLDKIASNLIQSFLRHTLRDGFFHADMHPGNLFVDPKGDIVAVDMGIAGRLGKKGTPLSSRDSPTVLSSVIICAWLGFILKRAMCRQAKTSTPLLKPFALLVSLSMANLQKQFLWRNCLHFYLR